MRKLLSLVLSIALLCSFTVFVFASEFTTTTVSAKAAFVTDVTEDGSNLTDDEHLDDNAIIQNIFLNITPQSSGNLQITAVFNNHDQVTIYGTPVARSENQHAVFFSAVCNDPSYEVIDMEYVDNAQTNMFFKGYGGRNSISKILKLYLKDISSETRDYIIIECFDFSLENFDSLANSLPQNTVRGAWAAREFTPAFSTYSDIATFADTSNTSRTYTVNYNEFTVPQTHTITIATDATYSNIRVGQSADIIYRIEITGKTMTCPGNPSINSSTESFLHVDTAALRQTTVPNVAFVSTSIDGEVQNNGSSSSSLSASIGVSFGAISASLSLPVSFSGSYTVDINNTYTGYVNGRNGNYTRSIKTAMDSSYKLTQIGYYFEVRSTMADFGNVEKAKVNHKATWDLTIINAGDMSTQSKTIIQNVPIAIEH